MGGQKNPTKNQNQKRSALRIPGAVVRQPDCAGALACLVAGPAKPAPLMEAVSSGSVSARSCPQIGSQVCPCRTPLLPERGTQRKRLWLPCFFQLDL
uniref:Uncharacterized protein n=1 Tax=Mustela putorius furo TaxID=9669 RepID=M3YFB4_MUSPF